MRGAVEESKRRKGKSRNAGALALRRRCHARPRTLCLTLARCLHLFVCFASAQATIEMEYHHSMLALYKQVSPRDVVVGWYSTSGSNESAASLAPGGKASVGTPEQLNYITSLMHEVYRGLMPANSSMEPLHLNVDVAMKGGMKIAGFVNQLIRTKQPAAAAAATPAPAAAVSASATPAAAAGVAAVPAQISADVLANFQPVPVELFAYEEEKIGLDALISGVPDDVERLDAPATFLTDAENVEQSVVKMLESIESIEAYIARVVEGKVAQPDTALALQIHQLLSSLPTLDAATFQNTFATHIQDLLSIVYLANMTKNQLAIADKANMLL